MTISERSKEFVREKFFLNEFEKGQIMKNGFNLMEKTNKPVNCDNYYRKQFCSSK